MDRIFEKVKIIDLSATIDNASIELQPVKIKYISHKKGAFLLGLSVLFQKKFPFKDLFLYLFGIKRITAKDFPDGLGLAWEDINIGTHIGTHLDSPWHFGPASEGRPAKTIDQIPLEWCYADGVVLDIRDKKQKELITLKDIQDALQRIKYSIKKNDIVLIMTGASQYAQNKEYLRSYPGISREAVFWLIKQGVKIIGTDTWGFDRPFENMIKDYLRTKDKNHLWPAHLVGREKEYCHIEKLVNLDKLPPYGFKVAVFPIKLKGTSAAWVRAVAIINLR
ncbi:MAG: cyclase family protein [Candidatus Omnitrophica bacterium]|nr:cyclase family protein [Candidatus Omnitrophota bacterium]